MGPNNLQNVNGQIRPSPDAEPDCSKGASSNVCKVSASLDQLTIHDNTGRRSSNPHCCFHSSECTGRALRAFACRIAPDRNIGMYSDVLRDLPW